MSTCDNYGSGLSHCTKSGHPLENHSLVNDNLLKCNYKWIELGPRGERWKWVICNALCLPNEMTGKDNRIANIGDPVAFYRVGIKPYQVFNLRIHSDNGQATLNYKRADGTIQSLVNKEYIDVLMHNSLVVTQVISGTDVKVEASVTPL